MGNVAEDCIDLCMAESIREKVRAQARLQHRCRVTERVKRLCVEEEYYFALERTASPCYGVEYEQSTDLATRQAQVICSRGGIVLHFLRVTVFPGMPHGYATIFEHYCTRHWLPGTGGEVHHKHSHKAY